MKNLHQVKRAMAMTPTYIRTNNVPGLTSAVRGPEGSPGSVRDVEKRDKPRRDLHKSLLQQFGFPGPPGGTDAGRVYAGLGGSVPGPKRKSPYHSGFLPGLGAQMYKRSSTADAGMLEKEALAAALRAATGLGRIGLKGLKYGVRGFKEAFPYSPTAGGARALRWTPSPASTAGPSWWKRFLRLNKPDTRYLTSPGTRPLIIRKPPSLGGFSKGATEKHAELYKESLVPVITGALGALGTGIYRGVTGESQGLGKDMAQGFWNWSGGSMLPTNLVNSDVGDAKTGWLPSMWGTRGDFGSQYGMSNAQRSSYEKMTPEQQKQYATTFMGGKSEAWKQHPASRTNKPGWLDRTLSGGLPGAAMSGPIAGAIQQFTPWYASGGGAYKNSIASPYAEGANNNRSTRDKAFDAPMARNNMWGYARNALGGASPPTRAAQHPGVNIHQAAPGGYTAKPWVSAHDTMLKGGADEGSGGFLSGLVKALSMLGVGAGGISAGTSADFLRRQLKYIKQYNPTVVTSGTTNPWYAGTARERVMPLIREGDVLVYGDSLRSPDAAGLRGTRPGLTQRMLAKPGAKMTIKNRTALGQKKQNILKEIEDIDRRAAQQVRKNVRVKNMRDLLSGGMGGFDEHSELITRSSKYPRDPLRSVLATNVAVNPAARRSPGVAMAIRGLTEFPKKYLHNIASAKKKGTSGGRAALPAFRRAWSGVLGDQFQQRRRFVDPAAKGSLTTSQLDDVLHQTYKQGPRGRTQGSMPMWQRLTVMGREPTPFSILRPKNYSQTKAHKYLKQVGNTTFAMPDTIQSVGLRRLMPRWATDLVEKIRNKVSPGASQAGAQCAGGVCKAVTGKGAYNLPSDLRHMKEFETVGDFIPQSALKQTGATRKNLEPLRKLMRTGAFKASLPGLIGGLGLAGLGMYGATKLAFDRWLLDSGTARPGSARVHPSWFPVIRKRFGPPHQSKLINNIVRAKSVGRYDYKGQIPAASQKKAPKPQPKRFEGYTTDPYVAGGKLGVPKLPSISSYTSPGPPKLDHLFKKDGTPVDAWSAQRKMIN